MQQTSCYRQDIQSKEYIYAVLQSIALIIMLAYLFYDSVWAVFALLPLGVWYFLDWIKNCCQKKQIDFREKFQESMKLMATSLKTGYSVENAIRETEKELRQLYSENSRICKEYSRMRYELDMNRTAEQVLTAFAERVQQEDAQDFVIVFSAAKRAGGDSISILKNAVKMISEKIEVEQEIQVMLAAKKLEFRIMCIVPLGLVFYMRFTFTEFFDVLYGNLLGNILMTGCLGVYMFAWRLGKKMTEIMC